jgi:hypothetical protein
MDERRAVQNDGAGLPIGNLLASLHGQQLDASNYHNGNLGQVTAHQTTI